MKIRSIILQTGQDLLIVFLVAISALGCYLMWTDDAYAQFVIQFISARFKDSPSQEVTTAHKMFITILMMAFASFLIIVFVHDNLFRLINKSKGVDK
jgi:TRAP-type C4-dicarboxylate transport system permease small subunit